jgi:hypothetical protein
MKWRTTSDEHAARMRKAKDPHRVAWGRKWGGHQGTRTEHGNEAWKALRTRQDAPEPSEPVRLTPETIFASTTPDFLNFL